MWRVRVHVRVYMCRNSNLRGVLMTWTTAFFPSSSLRTRDSVTANFNRALDEIDVGDQMTEAGKPIRNGEVSCGSWSRERAVNDLSFSQELHQRILISSRARCHYVMAICLARILTNPACRLLSAAWLVHVRGYSSIDCHRNTRAETDSSAPDNHGSLLLAQRLRVL